MSAPNPRRDAIHQRVLAALTDEPQSVRAIAARAGVVSSVALSLLKDDDDHGWNGVLSLGRDAWVRVPDL